MRAKGQEQDTTRTEPDLSRRGFVQKSSGALAAAISCGGLLSASEDAEAATRRPETSSQKLNNDQPGGGPCSSKSDPDITSRYERAQALLHCVRFTGQRKVLNTRVFPHWIGDSDSFWYVRESRSGTSYRIVDAAIGTNRPAFDHSGLASSLARVSGVDVDYQALPISDVSIEISPTTVKFSAFGKRWIYDDERGNCRELADPPVGWRISPDGKLAAFVRDYNLWVRDLETGRETALTRDGEKFRVYAGTPTVYGRQEVVTVEALWSPDSRRLFTVLIDTRKVKIGPPLVQHVPLDGSLRPTIVDPDRRVAFPGDEHIEGYQFLAIDVHTGRVANADYRLSPIFHPPYIGFFSGYRGWWNQNSREAYFIDLEVGGKVGRLVAFDTDTGDTRVVIEDRADSHFTFIPISHLGLISMPLPDTDEVVWYSERSGWAHLYLYDQVTGRLKNAITSGAWVVRNVLHYDSRRRELYIQTAGRKPDRNPYYCDICRVNVDTGKLTEIASSDHNYIVCDQRSRFSVGGFRAGGYDLSARGVSPSGRFVVSCRSTEDQVPVSLLLDRDGKTVLNIETADISAVFPGWRWPESVKLKAADGETDIYGLVFRPSDFDPTLSYPVLDTSIIYALPAGSFDHDGVQGVHYLEAASLAELGFIVVIIAARGTSLRSRAFTDAKSPLLSKMYNQEDCIAGIRQLAARYSYIDIERVGVGGQGSSAMAVTGLLGYPEFYKVGVTDCAHHDGRIFGAFALERLSEPGVPPVETLASKLKGKLLLVHGLLDPVTPAAQVYRLIYAFQQANRNVDMLILPNDGHGVSDYGRRRSWDYFVHHLRGVEPPDCFELQYHSLIGKS